MPTALVSGGTYGIGRAITLELARRGWRVVAFGLEARQPGSAAEKGMAGTRAALAHEGLDAELLEADTAEPGDVQRVVARARAEGSFEGLVCNAAIRPTGTILDTPESIFDRTLAVNLRGAYLLCRAAIPHMRERGGAIVLIGSGAARGKPDLLAYATSKGGLESLGLALARDHGRDGIRANVLLPAPRTASGMIEAIDASGGPAPGPSRRPEEVAERVAFLLSPDARGINGAVLDLAAELPDAG